MRNGTRGWNTATTAAALAALLTAGCAAEVVEPVEGAGEDAFGVDESGFGEGEESVGSTSEALTAPSPTATRYTWAGGYARLYQNGPYDRPIVIPEPFNPAEHVNGKRSPERFYLEMNGNPYLLGGKGMIQRLSELGYDIWLVQPSSVGDSIHRQAGVYARAVQIAANYSSSVDEVIAFGFSLGGLVIKIALARWASDSSFRSDWSLSGSSPPVSLIVSGDAPLRGALAPYDIMRETYSRKAEESMNMASCAAQQMSEVSMWRSSSGTWYHGDNHWYAFFYGGWSYSYYYYDRNGYWRSKYCDNEGVRVASLAWPPGIKRVAWTQGTLSTGDTANGICYDNYRDYNGDYRLTDSDGNPKKYDTCPRVGYNTFGYGAEYGRIDIDWYPDKNFYYRSYNWTYHRHYELEAGSKHDFIGDQHLADAIFGWWDMDAEQIRHAGTYIPSRSALDRACRGCSIPFDDYWYNRYPASHRHIALDSGRYYKSVVEWFMEHMNEAAGCNINAGDSCDGGDGDYCREGIRQCDGSCSDSSGTSYESCDNYCRDEDCDGHANEGCGEVCGDYVDNDCDGYIDEGCGSTCETCIEPELY